METRPLNNAPLDQAALPDLFFYGAIKLAHEKSVNLVAKVHCQDDAALHLRLEHDAHAKTPTSIQQIYAIAETHTIPHPQSHSRMTLRLVENGVMQTCCFLSADNISIESQSQVAHGVVGSQLHLLLDMRREEILHWLQEYFNKARTFLICNSLRLRLILSEGDDSDAQVLCDIDVEPIVIEQIISSPSQRLLNIERFMSLQRTMVTPNEINITKAFGSGGVVVDLTGSRLTFVHSTIELSFCNDVAGQRDAQNDEDVLLQTHIMINNQNGRINYREEYSAMKAIIQAKSWKSANLRVIDDCPRIHIKLFRQANTRIMGASIFLHLFGDDHHGLGEQKPYDLDFVVDQTISTALSQIGSHLVRESIFFMPNDVRDVQVRNYVTHICDSLLTFCPEAVSSEEEKLEMMQYAFSLFA